MIDPRLEASRRSAFAMAAAVVLLAGCPAAARAVCPDRESMERRADAYLAEREVHGFETPLSVEEGYCAQRRYQARLKAHLGEPVGYKVSFVSPAAQAEFGIAEPARGVLFGPMLLPSGAELPAKFGVRPVYEADMLAVVGSDALNDAETMLDAARGLSEVRAFIEAADFVLADGIRAGAGPIIAVNIFARYGIQGTGIRVEPTDAFVKALADMDVVMTSGSGAELTRAKGSALMGHPLEVVLWFVRHRRAAGLPRLEAGDVLSLGSFGRLQTPVVGQTVRLRYDGLPGGAVA